MVHQCKELTHSHDGSGVDRPLSRALLHLRPQELLVRREAERVGSDGRGESLCSLARAVSITFEENYFKEEKLTTKGNAPLPAAPPAPPAESRREQDSPAPPAESRSEKDSPAGLTLHRGDKRGTFPESHFQRFCFTCSNHPVAQYGPFPFPALCSGSQCRFLRGTVHDHL